MQSVLTEPEPDVWTQIAPLLGRAMEHLGQKDHDAVVLRFFEGKSFQEIGTALGASENAAKKRVAYALDKLRKFFFKHGIPSTTAAIAVALSTNSVQAAPVALAQTSTALAIAKGATTSTSTLTLAKGALKIMAWTKAKTAIVVGMGVLLLAGTTSSVVVRKLMAIHQYRQGNGTTSQLNRLPIADRTTPKGVFLVMENAMEAGDENAYAECFLFTSSEELKLKATLESLVAANARFNKAISDKFGDAMARAVFPNLPFAFPRDLLASATEKIDGDTASLTVLGKGGRPIEFKRIDNEWKMTAEGFVHLNPAVMNDICIRLVKSLDETTAEIPQNKYATAMEAVDKMKERAR
jgi:voltage-gated potassium channel Kch